MTKFITLLSLIFSARSYADPGGVSKCHPGYNNKANWTFKITRDLAGQSWQDWASEIDMKAGTDVEKYNTGWGTHFAFAESGVLPGQGVMYLYLRDEHRKKQMPDGKLEILTPEVSTEIYQIVLGDLQQLMAQGRIETLEVNTPENQERLYASDLCK